MKYVARTLAATAWILAVTIAFTAAPAAATRLGASGADETGLSPFRVDVSRYPYVGMVVTAPGGLGTLTSRDVTAEVGRMSEHPTVRPLSADDVELVLSPDVRVPSAELRTQQADIASFLVELPAGAQAAVGPSSEFTSDPSVTVKAAEALRRGYGSSAAARLAAALSAFSSGAQVRRTVVLVVGQDEPLAAAAATRFRQQLAASGTALYVLDASPYGASAYDTLAAGSGGFAVRVSTGAEWLSALSQISTELSNQYYLRFTDTQPLPDVAVVSVHTAAGPVRGAVSLPLANPAPPPPLPPAPDSPRSLQAWPLAVLSLALITALIAYGLAMVGASRREPRARKTRRHGPPSSAGASASNPDDLFFVFLMPCLNEERVIMNSLKRLLSLPSDNFAVMVVDDGSDDATCELVSSVVDDRVWLLQRRLPNARQGKGEALNAAIAHLNEAQWLAERDPQQVIVVVVDADGRLDPNSLSVVAPYFEDPAVGAVQIGVRINNRGLSRLARMQDMEFVIYTEVFQRGRRHLGSVGLGGNGQFMRLAALRSLGGGPWTRSLTEDLDLGIRLLTAGWRNEYCPAAAVHQQGVLELRRLIRQRSRWFQGHLQSWKLIPRVLRKAPRSARADLLYHLSSPAILLIASVLTASFLCSLLGSGIVAAQGNDPLGLWVATTYALAFGPALVYSYIYWLREREEGVSLFRTAGLAHLYVCYGLMWYAAGWWAVGRTLRGRTGWAKTDRAAEAPLPMAAPLAIDSPTAPDLALNSSKLLGSEQMFIGANMPEAPRPLTALDISGATAPAPGQQAPGDAGETPQVSGSRGAAGASGRGPHWRRHRLRLGAAAILLAVSACTLAVLLPSKFNRSRNTQWYQVFSGYGHNQVTGSGANPAITLSVATTHSRHVTHAALVLSKARYDNFVASAEVQTVRQLRAGSAGNPNPWEVGWVVWHYSSPQRFYALTLEPTGWLLSKQDPAYPGGERFLTSGTLPRFPVGSTHRVGIVQVGNRITVSADGHLLAIFTDTQRPYLSGGFGAYAEDSVASFRDIHLQPLPGTEAYTPTTQPESVN